MYWLILAGFVIFFFVIGPALLYWFIRFASRTMMDRKKSLIGFPEDKTPLPRGREDS
jgi:hypothetical protein